MSSRAETTRTTVSHRGSGRVTSTRRTGLPTVCAPARCGSTATACLTPRCRSAVTRSRAGAGRWATTRSRITSKPSRWSPSSHSGKTVRWRDDVPPSPIKEWKRDHRAATEATLKEGVLYEFVHHQHTRRRQRSSSALLSGREARASARGAPAPGSLRRRPRSSLPTSASTMRPCTPGPSSTRTRSGPSRRATALGRAVHDRARRLEPAFYKWFTDGKLNVSYNCLDRHVEAGHGDRVAFHWAGEEGERRAITYAELHARRAKACERAQRAGRRRRATSSGSTCR